MARQLSFYWDGKNYIRVMTYDKVGDNGPPYCYNGVKYDTLSQVKHIIDSRWRQAMAHDVFLEPLSYGLSGTVVTVHARG
jgi:hypothetical protein